MEQLFYDDTLDRLIADLAREGWRVRLEQVEEGWMAQFRRVNGSVEELSMSGEPKPAGEAIQQAAAGIQNL